MTAKQIEALAAISRIVVESIKASGSNGMPGGHLYAALMTTGCNLEQFERLMSLLVGGKLVTKRGDLYFAA